MNRLKVFLVFLIVGLSIFTHFYRIDQTYIFQNDEGRDALITFKMIDTGRPVLLGPETSVGNMYLGPFYYYLMVPALYLSHLDPVGPAIMVAILGIATTYLIFLLGRRSFGYWAGAIGALFYALSPIMLHHSRNSWNPNVLPFFVALLLLLPNFKKPIWQLSFGLLVGIIFQLHYVALILPGFMFLASSWEYLRERKFKSYLSFCLVALAGFLISSSPFWLFEYRHDFVNSSAFLTYLTATTSSNSVYPPFFNRFGSNLRLLIDGVLYSSSLTPAIPTFMTIAGIILFLGSLIFSGSRYSSLIFFSILALSFLKEKINVHYLAFCFPLVAVWFGSLFSKAKIIRLLMIALAIYLLIHFYPSHLYAFSRTENAQVRRSRETAEYIVSRADGRPYNVVGSQGTFTSTISYFLAISSNPPRNDLQPLLFDICTGGPCKSDEETTVLLYLTGPAHPSLLDYLGHPAINEFTTPRKIIKNEWVTYDIYVATIELRP
jgi:4-amino-4-deoxy-L-arabinose transferase-like glycosyltransferase